MLDPRTPVIVGVGQVNHRDAGAEPIDLMARSTELALADSGAAALRQAIQTVRVVWGVWPYRDPGRLVAERIGVAGARTTITSMGGNQVYDLVADTASRIAAGELDVAVVCAAETLRTRRRDHAEGKRTAYLPERDNAAADELFGKDTPMSTDTERAVKLDVAVHFYAMAETAIRHRNGESVTDHKRRIAELWAGASAVAAANPEAWIRTAHTADEIATEGPRNRAIASPYPKLMTANLDVDQGGAVVICSAAAAEAAGVPRDRWVFPWSAAGAADHWYPTNRWSLDDSPAMRLAGQRALDLAGLGVADCDVLDLYSCFPAAVQLAQRGLGIDPARPFTITGGLTFAAGPLNCYCVLPLVGAVRLLRDAPESRALLTGNGGYFTKHSMLTLAAAPPPSPFRSESVQAEVDALPSRPTPPEPPAGGTVATLETYTVVADRDGNPTRAIAACLDAHGLRHWALLTEPGELTELLDRDRCGASIELDGINAQLA